MKILEDEWQVVIKAYTFTVLLDFERFFFHILCVCAIPTYTVY